MLKHFSFSKLLNLVLILFVGGMLIQRIPVLVDMFQRQGHKAPAVTVRTISGDLLSVPLPQKHLIVFWATWCPPCKVELARINKLVKNGDIKPQDVIAISSAEDLDTVMNHAKENDYRFTVGIDKSSAIAQQYKVSGTPTLLLINQNGVIEWMTMGVSPSLELRLKSFLK